MSVECQTGLSELLRAACCGVIATVPMTAAMLGIQRLLPQHSREPQEPRQITGVLMDRVDSTPDIAEDHRDATALVAHFGYGAAAGALYPVVDRTFQGLPGRGAAYGLAVYTISYAGWLPLCGILPAPQRRPSGRNLLLIASHLVWGAALQAAYTNSNSQTEANRD